MAEHDERDIKAAVAGLDACERLGEYGAKPKAAALQLRGSPVHILFMEQRNGQIEVYRTPNAAKAASLVADGHLGKGGCDERAMDREMAVAIARRYAAEERQKLKRKRARDGEAPATPEGPSGAGADNAAVAAELAAVKTELAQSEKARQVTESALAVSQSRVAELEAEAARFRRVLSDASAELTHAVREAEAHSRQACARVAQIYADIEAIQRAAA
jgi:hypothetical protein